MKIGAISLLPAISLNGGAARILAVMLTACTGRGGGYIYLHRLSAPACCSQATAFGISFSCGGRGGTKPNPSKEEES
jgi:hypothetical protein